jgi:phospholipase/lecithinase/hemolysin
MFRRSTRVLSASFSVFFRGHGVGAIFWDSLRISLLAALVLTVSAARAETLTKIVAFGDSLTDTGNVYSLTSGLGFPYPSSPYWNGRFSNGEVWVEDLADKLGLLSPTASRTGGTNYAYGGTTSGSGYATLSLPNLGPQVSTYLSAVPGGHADPSALYVVWAGSNDFLNTLGSNPTATQLDACSNNMSTWATNVSNAVSALHAAGAARLLVANLAPLGSTPKLNQNVQKDNINSVVAGFNDLLSTNLLNLESVHPDLFVEVLDAYGLCSEAIAHPSSYGFENVTNQAMGTSGANPAKYLFWDSVHPTAAAHAMLANAAAQMIPEPSTLVLLSTGAISLLAYARHRRRS